MPTSQQMKKQRIILLLDLDCFYAQVECVRLGFNTIDSSLALLQWNSVLAVTYPARRLYGIKRGDSWGQVKQKSNGQCNAIHVPILTTASCDDGVAMSLQGDFAADADATACATASIGQEYSRIFQTNEFQQEQARKEIGVRRFSSEGKASIERYRIASARIFEAVLEWIESNGLRDKVILERASIDEFFLDVTAACWESGGDSKEECKEAFSKTKIIGNLQEKEAIAADSECQALQRGCFLAYSIRKTIFDKLAFTLSAGISFNKTLAKLSAGHGKPNGQAVTFPCATEFLLDQTEIRSCRNLGGKLGARVQTLLPEGAPATVGSIARFLSLPDLQKGLENADTATWVHQIAQGVDNEAVISKNGSALTKSITAFKSLPSQQTLEQAASWIKLLASELVTRVGRDAARNSRYPRTCNIQYAQSGRQNKSVRTNFPTEKLPTEGKVQELVEKVPQMIRSKEGKDYRLNRVGLCAVDFVNRAGKGINAYFSAKTVNENASSASTAGKSQSVSKNLAQELSHNAEDSDLQLAKKLQAGYDTECRLLNVLDKREKKGTEQLKRDNSVDPDLELAKRLQANYDRENRIVQAIEKHEKASGRRASKARRIDTFFQKR